MPPANRDSSELTRKRREMALYAYASANTSAVNAGTSVRREQPTVQMAEVIVQRKQGGCYCASANAGTYDMVGCGPCRGGV